MIRFENGGYFSYERIGRFDLKSEWIHPERVIKSYELIVVLEGTLYIGEEGHEYLLRKNDAIILEPELRHYGLRTVSEPLSFYWLHYRTNLPMPFKLLMGAEIHDVKYLMKKLLHISNTESTAEEEIDALALLILKEAERQADALAEPIPPLIGLIRELVRNTMPSGIGVSQISATLGYNKDYLGKLFQRHTGQSLKDYIAKKRIAYAENLLLTTDMSVKEIAGELGYSDENAFLKFFAYHKGISPKSFKNQYYNTHLNRK